MLRVHVKVLQKNYQQIKELQAAYENRKRFAISLNGTYAKLLWSGTSNRSITEYRLASLSNTTVLKARVKSMNQ